MRKKLMGTAVNHRSIETAETKSGRDMKVFMNNAATALCWAIFCIGSCLGEISRAQPEDETNLVSNGDFEEGNTGWSEL